jgi:hypothetical protein
MNQPYEIAARLLEDEDFDPKEFVMRVLSTLTPEQQRDRGGVIARTLKMRRDQMNLDRWQTVDGTKTGLGVFLTVLRIIEQGE